MMATNGFAQGVTDVHSHIITPELVSALESDGRLMDEGFPLPKYNVENHLRWMDEAGVQTSVLTLAAPQPSSANVKVIVPHCGAYLPLSIPRMKSLTPVMQANKMVGEIDYEANLRALYYDLAGAHSPEVIRMLLTVTTPDHLLYGSDYPYVAPQVLTQSLARMKDYLSKEPDLAPFKEMILWKSAKWLFGQTGEKPSAENTAPTNMIVRIAEIEVYPKYLNEYLAIANEVDRLSMELEPGVVCLFPMQSAEDSTKIRILEIYASEEAYQQHLKTDHFQKYKQGTLHMVKDLKLPTMKPLDPETMDKIFKIFKR
jgi:quinol monooxygenase YgiN